MKDGMIVKQVMPSPAGLLELASDDVGLCALRLASGNEPICPGKVSPLLEEAKAQLRAYFDRKLTRFDLPLSIHASPFESDVWQMLRRIPYGEIRSYSELASALGRPSASRAVGGACGRNPLLIVIPCHRVVGADGRLTGFAAGLETKRMLLTLEGHRVELNRIAGI